MIPVFKSGKSLFEGQADVTEKVSERVKNWRRRCGTRIKHIFCRPETKKRRDNS